MYKFPIKPPYRITQKFGENKLDYSQFGLKGHNGVDIAVPQGTPILCPNNGTITHVKNDVPANGKDDNGYGNYIRMEIIDSGKYYQWTFGHLLPNVEVHINQPVYRGELLAHVDTTGFSTGNHLHLGVRELTENGSVVNYDNGYLGYIDPMPFFENTAEEIFPVDMRYNAPESSVRELKWKMVHESYAKKKARENAIPWSERLMYAFVYGYWGVDEVFNVAMVETWRNMTKPEYLKRLGKL